MKRQVAILGLVLAATAAAYLPSIDGELVFDDVRAAGDPLVIAPFDQSPWSWLGSPRPVTTFTFALNHLAVGLDTRGWHLTNVAIHLAVVVLAWLVARLTLTRAGLSRPDGPALAAAGLFALHPLQTESVSYISQRAESIASGIYLAALLLLLRRDETPTPWRRRALLAAAVTLGALGLAAKPIAATLPAAWLLHAAMIPVPAEAALSGWRRAWRRVPAALPLFALSVAAAARAIGGSTRSTSEGFSLPGLSADRYLATQLRVIPTYLRLLAWPAGQCADRWFRISVGLLEPAALTGAALLGAIAFAGLVAAARSRGATGDGPAAARAASFGSLFFLVVLAPSSSVLPLIDPYAEHRVYLAALGIFIAGAAGATVATRKLTGRRAAAVGASIGLVLLAAAGIATARRNVVWATSLALWSDAAGAPRPKARAVFNLGQAIWDSRRSADALASFLRARDLADGSVAEKDLLENTVSLLLALARPGDARAEVAQALAERPDEPEALAQLARVDFVASRGRSTEAERGALAALALDPGNVTALQVLAKIRLARGDALGAREALRAAAAKHVVDSSLYWDLGQLEERAGDVAAACAAYARAAAQPLNRWVSARASGSHERLRCP